MGPSVNAGNTIISTQGLELLRVLEELYLPGNQITSIDVSTMPNLRVLDLSDNPISQLDTSHNPQLTSLHMADVYTLQDGVAPLTVDFSHNSRLKSLDLRLATTVVLPASDSLTDLSLTLAADLPAIGQPAAVTNTYYYGKVGYVMDLSKYPNLHNLSLTGHLQSVKLPVGEKLESLTIRGATTVFSANLTDAPKLKTLTATLADSETSFDLSRWPQLTELNLTANGLQQLDLM